VTQERRAQPRAPLTSTVVAFVGDRKIDCTAMNISMAGIAVQGPKLAEAGQFLRLNFCLTTGAGVPRWFDADGVVVRLAVRDDDYVVGVQFLVIEDRAAREIHGFVEHTLRAAEEAAAAPPQASAASSSSDAWPGDPIPDAMNPPDRTGEFGPASADKRRTAEYGSNSSRTPTNPPRTTSSSMPAAGTPARGTPVVPSGTPARGTPVVPSERRRDTQKSATPTQPPQPSTPDATRRPTPSNPAEARRPTPTHTTSLPAATACRGRTTSCTPTARRAGSRRPIEFSAVDGRPR